MYVPTVTGMFPPVINVHCARKNFTILVAMKNDSTIYCKLKSSEKEGYVPNVMKASLMKMLHVVLVQNVPLEEAPCFHLILCLLYYHVLSAKDFSTKSVVAGQTM